MRFRLKLVEPRENFFGHVPTTVQLIPSNPQKPATGGSDFVVGAVLYQDGLRVTNLF